MTSSASPLWRKLQVYQIYGANTNVGKTVVSTLLCRASRNAGFLKPVSTGPRVEADDRHVQRFAPGTITQCLHQFQDPVSPHIAAVREKQIPSNDEVVGGIHKILTEWEVAGLSHAFVETAGGVHSPGPSGTSQADLYRPLRLPVVLVADFHLGGISSSISAYESLLVRGYDVESVVMFKDTYYQNSEYLRDFFLGKNIPLLALKQPPERPLLGSQASIDRDGEAMEEYYTTAVADGNGLSQMMFDLSDRHDKRIDEVESMVSRAHKSIWYPFTQHSGLQPKALTVIDSAKGDHFQVFQPSKKDTSSAVLGPVFDGSASWWTQGLGHGNPDLALGAAYAAGRYGHVMFALCAHKPAIDLAELMLKNIKNERLSKVFYSDNGSTAMEVAVKMALRASCDRYGWDASREEIGIIGLKGSYHGDTIGTMDCSEPSTFNKKVEWYRGRGYWFDFPQVKMIDGEWTIKVPDEMAWGHRDETARSFRNLPDIFDIQARETSDMACWYEGFIRAKLTDLVSAQGRKFGALMLEPIVLGAGGMLFVDPLFQHILIRTIRSDPSLIDCSAAHVGAPSSSWSGLPVIFDEVFTGLYRLYHFSPSFLFPESSRSDISAHAKLLTGGLLPLAMTLASEEIFNVFNSSPVKEQALLHGHSYTAHPVGCHVAKLSVQTMMKMEQDDVWGRFTSGGCSVWSIWPDSLLTELSKVASIESVWALGTVLAIVLRDQSGGGYSSSVSQDLQLKLRSSTVSEPVTGNEDKEEQTEVPFSVQSRVLGNVLYLMASLTSRRDEIDEICVKLRKTIV